MTITRSELAAEAAHLRTLLRGARLQEVRVPDADRVVLSLRVPGQTVFLLLCVAPRLGRLHTIVKRPKNPQTPVAFQGLLRKELPRGLDAIELVEGERIVLLRFVGPAPEDARTLVLEVYGNGGNLVLTDGNLTVLGRARGPRGPGCKARRGEPWAPPAAGAMSVAEEEHPDIDESLRARYSGVEETRAREDALSAALASVRTERRKLRRKLKRQRGDVERAGDPDRLRRRAELLQGSFHLLRRGASSVEVTDWAAEGTPRLVLELDPALGPSEQVDAAFQRTRRAERGRTRAEEKVAETERALEALDEREAGLVAGSIEPPAIVERGRTSRAQREAPRRPWRSFWTAGGVEIRVGRSAADNDALTLRHSKGNDVWLHVRGRPGAHVVIRDPGPSPSPELLVIGAQLALLHSGLKDGAREEVGWTRVKHVRKPKGLPPGKVIVGQQKTLYVEADRAVLETLSRDPTGARSPG